uniref:Tc1-like transposase DDE domain-containing protein n=1 Tax=Amphiprion percula TaxID=161767 RepID=A0A3P8SFB9_AMPPE
MKHYLQHVQYLIMKHVGGSIMVWGCMTAAVVGHLTVCDDTLNSAKYCTILQTYMLPSAHQDTALATHPVQVELAQSPDMSPTENLWWIIKRSASKHKPKNLEELKAIFQGEWGMIIP